MCVHWWLQLSMKIRISEQRPWNREPRLVYMQPAIQCFLRKFNVDLYNAVTALKAARVMCPVTVGWLRPTRASVEALMIFPFLDNEATIDSLVRGCHSTSLLLRMWLLNPKEEKLSGGRSTKRGFLIGLLWSRKSSLFNLLVLLQKEFLACLQHLSMSSKRMHFLTTSKQV